MTSPVDYDDEAGWVIDPDPDATHRYTPVDPPARGGRGRP